MLVLALLVAAAVSAAAQQCTDAVQPKDIECAKRCYKDHRSTNGSDGVEPIIEVLEQRDHVAANRMHYPYYISCVGPTANDQWHLIGASTQLFNVSEYVIYLDGKELDRSPSAEKVSQEHINQIMAKIYKDVQTWKMPRYPWVQCPRDPHDIPMYFHDLKIVDSLSSGHNSELGPEYRRMSVNFDFDLFYTVIHTVGRKNIEVKERFKCADRKPFTSTKYKICP